MTLFNEERRVFFFSSSVIDWKSVFDFLFDLIVESWGSNTVFISLKNPFTETTNSSLLFFISSFSFARSFNCCSMEETWPWRVFNSSSFFNMAALLMLEAWVTWSEKLLEIFSIINSFWANSSFNWAISLALASRLLAISSSACLFMLASAISSFKVLIVILFVWSSASNSWIFLSLASTIDLRSELSIGKVLALAEVLLLSSESSFTWFFNFWFIVSKTLEAPSRNLICCSKFETLPSSSLTRLYSNE